MNPLSYSSYRFLRDIIQRAVWMYPRFALSFHNVEELLAERGITVTYVCISDNNTPVAPFHSISSAVPVHQGCRSP
jgi:transposase-like protein